MLVDGFAAAVQLRTEDHKAWAVLTKVGLPWHASGNKGITIAPDKKYPVIELDRDTARLHRIRWNNDDRGVVPIGSDGEPTPEEWYEAARKWDSILRRKENECWIQLEPGRVLIFDNWRVLHGRSAFSGIRRICGAYSKSNPLPISHKHASFFVLTRTAVNRDDYMSRWMNTNLDRQEIMRRVLG